jgi:hypothetical protein
VLDRGSLEILAVQAARLMGDVLKGAVPEGVGFAVLIFDFGAGGNLAYVSNAQRADMVKAMREFITKVEAGAAPSVFASSGHKRS